MNTEPALPPEVSSTPSAAADSGAANPENAANAASPAASPGRLPLKRPSNTVLLAGVGLVLFAALWLDGRSRMNDLRAEVAQRLATGDALLNESRRSARQTQESLQALLSRTTQLEARLAQMQAQQMTLEGIYQELSHSREERLVSEIEQAVSLAAQQLQLAGNVEAALIALQTADARLARAGLPQLLPLRKQINHDIDRLKSLPLADIPGISLKLEGLMMIADTLPLAFEQRARAEPLVKQRLNVATPPPGWWEEMAKDIWTEFRQLIRVERVEHSAHAEVALLSPGQVFFLRENLKLRLLTARLALLQRDGKTYREDIRQTQFWLERYFDTREKSVSTAIQTLKSLAAADLSLELPTLNDTLGSLRQIKLSTEKGK